MQQETPFRLLVRTVTVIGYRIFANNINIELELTVITAEIIIGAVAQRVDSWTYLCIYQ